MTVEFPDRPQPTIIECALYIDPAATVTLDDGQLVWSSEAHPATPTQAELDAAADAMIAEGHYADWRRFVVFMLLSDDGLPAFNAMKLVPGFTQDLIAMAAIAQFQGAPAVARIEQIFVDAFQAINDAGLVFSDELKQKWNAACDAFFMPEWMRQPIG